MIDKKEVENNINSEWQITLNYQKESRYGLCKFIIEVCQRIGLSHECCSLAMLITNFFFIRKCYLNYDKLSIACAAILISSKMRVSQSKFNDICKEYVSTANKIKNKTDILFIKDNIKIKEQINKHEIYILKELNFDIPDEDDFPFDLIFVYSELLYPDGGDGIANLATKIVYDSFFTYVNNIYKNYVVALSCLAIASQFLEVPNFLEEGFKYLDNMKKINTRGITGEEFDNLLIHFNNNQYIELKDKEKIENDKYFEKLTLCQKLHPDLKMEDLEDCTSMIVEFYEDMKIRQEKYDMEKK